MTKEGDINLANGIEQVKNTIANKMGSVYI
jgi:hypothetical protein